MRINKYISQATGLSRRRSDDAIADGRVQINGVLANLGDQAIDNDTVTLDDKKLMLDKITTIAMHKPAGYICSRNGQGGKTIYDILPKQYHNLKPVGRLDKESSGLLLLTNDGDFAYKLTHPSFKKDKVYEVELDKAVIKTDLTSLEKGVKLSDGVSNIKLKPIGSDGKHWQVRMHEGRNRQIRRTFAHLGYQTILLHRINFGNFELGDLAEGKFAPAKLN